MTKGFNAETNAHCDPNDPVFAPMQQALLERIANRRELAEIEIRYVIRTFPEIPRSQKTAHLKELEHHIDDVAVTLHSLESRLKTDTNRSTKLAKEADALRMEVAACGRSVIESQNRLDSACLAVSNIRRDHDIARAEVKALRSELLTVKQHREATEHEIQEYRLSISKSNSENAQTERERVSQARELDRFKSIMEQLTDDIECMKDAILNKDRERQMYSDILRETLKATACVDQDIRRSESAIRESTRALEKRFQLLSESTKLITETDGKSKLVDKQIEGVRTELDRTSDLVNDLESGELVSLANKRKIQQNKLESLTLDLERMKPVLDEINTRMRTITSGNGDVENEIRQVDNQLETMRKSKAHISEETQRLNAEVLAIVSHKSAANNELGAKIKLHNTHRAFLLERTKEAEEMEAKCSAAALERRQCESTCEGLRGVVQRADREMAGIQMEISKISKDLERRKKLVELKTQKLDRIRSQLMLKAKEAEEAVKSHDKSKSSISLEARVKYLEEELRMIIYKCTEFETLNSQINLEQGVLSEEMHRVRGDLDSLRIRKIVFEGIRKRKNIAIAKIQNDENATRKEITVIEREYSRVGEIRDNLRTRESEIETKLRGMRDLLEKNSKISEIGSFLKSNEEIESEIVLLETSLEEQSNLRCSLEAQLKSESEVKSVKAAPKRSELVNVIRKLKHALTRLEREKTQRQRAAVARINEWDIDTSTLPGLVRGRHMASTCSTMASSTLSLENDDIDDLNESLETVRIEILRLKCELDCQAQVSPANCTMATSKIRAIGTSLLKVGKSLRPKVFEKILEWHQFNEEMSS